MTEADVFGFAGLAKRVASVFRMRTDTEDFRLLTSSYYRALSRHTLPDLERAADVWIAKAEKFPKPMEWAASIPARQIVDLPVMTDAQSREYAEAEQQRYERKPCDCPECRVHQVSHLPQRFVPEFTAYDTDRKVRDPLRDRIVTAGHWAHGRELRGYYDAMAAFFSLGEQLKMGKTIRKVMAPVFVKKPMTQVGR